MKKFIKEKLKNKFLVGIVGIIFIILGIGTYMSTEFTEKDLKSYVESIEGNIYLNNVKLNLNESKVLKEGDIIETKANSLAVINWGEGSLTRLGENSKSTIKELFISSDLLEIRIKLYLGKGRYWSNIVSYIGEDSNFSMEFQDITATVRGTTFDIDLSKNFVYVENHEVLLKKGDKEKLIKEGKVFDFFNFSFIEIKKYLEELGNDTWIKVNEEYDKIHLDELKKQISQKFSRENISNLIVEAVGDNADDLKALNKKIEELSSVDKEKVYKALLKQYQKINFIGANDGELFKAKNDLKKLLISSANKKNKKNLIRYTLYDLENAFDLKNLDAIKNSLNVLGENMDIVKNMDFDLNTDFFTHLKNTPIEMKDFLEKNGNLLKNVVGDKIKNFDLSDFNINLDGLRDEASVLKKKADKLRDEARGKILEFIK